MRIWLGMGLLLCSVQASAENWVLSSANDDGEKAYVDTSSINRFDASVLIWTKMIPAKTKANGYAYHLHQTQINCASRVYTMRAIFKFKLDGTTGESLIIGNDQFAPGPLTPGSHLDFVSKRVCT